MRQHRPGGDVGHVNGKRGACRQTPPPGRCAITLPMKGRDSSSQYTRAFGGMEAMSLLIGCMCTGR